MRPKPQSLRLLLFLALCSTSSLVIIHADATNWANSPNNFENSPLNFQNSPNNFNNSPMNFQNNPMNLNSDRIIRDNSGHARGYAVPKSDGGVNYFDLQGHREGYEAGEE